MTSAGGDDSRGACIGLSYKIKALICVVQVSAFFLFPVFCEEEIADVSMFDAVTAHVEFVEGDDVFRIVVPDAVINAEFAGDGFFACQEVGDLDVELFAVSVADEVDFPVPGPADGDMVATAEKLEEDDVLQNQVDIPHVAAENGLAYAVVCDVVLFVCGECLLSDKILAIHLINQIGVTAVADIVEDRLGRDFALFAFQKFRK